MRVNILSQNCPIHNNAISVCLLNSRSVRNKSSILKGFVVDKDIDLLALTETWLKPGNIDSSLKSKNDLWLKCLKTTSFRLPDLQSSTVKMNEKKAVRKFE